MSELTPTQNAEYVAPNCEPFEGSCDACAEGEKRIVHVDEDTSAYICEDCIALEEQAIRAAAEAILEQWHRRDAPVEYANRLARIAVNAYVMAKWRAEHSDGDGCDTPPEGRTNA